MHNFLAAAFTCCVETGVLAHQRLCRRILVRQCSLRSGAFLDEAIRSVAGKADCNF